MCSDVDLLVYTTRGMACVRCSDTPDIRVCTHQALPHSVTCAWWWVASTDATVGYYLAGSCCDAGHCKVVLGSSMCLALFVPFVAA
jgi:hypothetical protein